MLRGLGFWWSPAESHLPDPRDFVDGDWPTSERRVLVERLQEGFTPWVAAGLSHCRLCGRACGSAERTDGVYLWPEGLAHYVSAHAVRIDVELTSFASTVSSTSIGGRRSARRARPVTGHGSPSCAIAGERVGVNGRPILGSCR